MPNPPRVITLGIAISAALAMVTGLPPALRARRLTIVDALVRK